MLGRSAHPAPRRCGGLAWLGRIQSQAGETEARRRAPGGGAWYRPRDSGNSSQWKQRVARIESGRLSETMADTDLQAQVAIIGAGPAGMLLSHLLAADGVESVVLETRSEEYVASRIRAGILEQSTVDLLTDVGLGERLAREGDQHRGIYLQWPGERHHLDFVDLVGRSVTVYGQTDVQKDLGRAREAAGQEIHYGTAD